MAEYFETDEEVLQQRWQALERWLQARFGRETGIEAILFLIGIQSRGRGFEPRLSKEVKQDLIMEGTYCALETLGFYERVGMDEDERWVWEQRRKPPADLSIDDQEKLLRIAILSYFEPILPDQPEP